MQLIVLGMHRSGTSVLARILNLMGVYFGPEGISTGANEENPKGFWERRDVRHLNDLVLHSMGCDWNRVSQFAVDSLPQEVVAEFDKRASRLVLEIDAHRPWVLKEPRLCLLLPLWRKWLEAPVCIHIYRSPVEVASSLKKRNGIPMEAGLALWSRYTESALKGADGLPQIVVLHRRLMQEPLAAIERLLEELQAAAVPGLRMPSRREIAAFIRDDLYRERDSHEDLRSFAGSTQVRLFDALQAGLAPDKDLLTSKTDQAALTRYEASLPPLVVPDEKKKAEPGDAALRAELAMREQELKFVKALREQENGFNKDLASKREALADLRGQVALAQREAQSAQHAFETQASLTEERDRRLATSEARELALQEAATGMRVDLALRAQQLSDLERELAGLRESAAELSVQLRSREEDNSRLEMELETLQQANAGLECRIKDQGGLIELLETRLKSKSDLVQSLESEGSKIRDMVAGLEAGISDRDRSLATLEADAMRDARALRQAEAAGRRSEQEVVLRFQELAKLTETLLDREASLTSLRAGHAALEVRNQQLEALHREQETRLQLLQDAAAELDSELAKVRGSRSWRMTRPFRSAARMLRPGTMPASASAPPSAERLLQESPLFDREWYLAMYEDVRISGTDPLEHFLRFGADERRNPGPDFDTGKYLEANPDVAQSGFNPLVHYLSFGKNEGRSRR